MQHPNSQASSLGSMREERPQFSAGKFGKYTCTRCGWKWTPRQNSPDPPHACARCRSVYWQSAPVSTRANWPNDPKWQAERDSVARRRQERHIARLRELATEFGLTPPPILDDLTIAPPVVTLPKEPSQPAVIAVDPRVRFNEPASSQLPPAPAIPPAPRRPLAEALQRAMAEWKANPEPSPPGGPGQPTRRIAPLK
jgi:hypothetical protein